MSGRELEGDPDSQVGLGRHLEGADWLDGTGDFSGKLVGWLI